MLRQFAWGVPAFVLAKVLTPPFVAREDTRRPMIFAVSAVLMLGSLIALALMPEIPLRGAHDAPMQAE